jgi:DNA mismatch endonuclease (patch repair protein)
MMSRIRGRNTAPERTLRSLLHRHGFRFTLHRRDLPGSPDIVLPRYRTIVFVHGCFWHRHADCKFAYSPKSRQAFWTRKFAENKKRDKSNLHALTALGWRTIVVWECQLRSAKSAEAVGNAIARELRSTLRRSHHAVLRKTPNC